MADVKNMFYNVGYYTLQTCYCQIIYSLKLSKYEILALLYYKSSH